MMKVVLAGIFGATLLVATAHAEPVVGIAVAAPATTATVAAGAGVAVLAHEAFAKKPFGRNGEGMKAARGLCRGIGFKRC